MINTSRTEWPDGCQVKFVGGYDLQPSASRLSTVPAAKPMQAVNVNVLLVTPTVPGRYTSYFRLCTPDGFEFGDQLWCDLTVTDTEEEASAGFGSQMIYPTINTNVDHQESGPTTSKTTAYDADDTDHHDPFADQPERSEDSSSVCSSSLVSYPRTASSQPSIVSSAHNSPSGSSKVSVTSDFSSCHHSIEQGEQTEYVVVDNANASDTSTRTQSPTHGYQSQLSRFHEMVS